MFPFNAHALRATEHMLGQLIHFLAHATKTHELTISTVILSCYCNRSEGGFSSLHDFQQRCKQLSIIFKRVKISSEKNTANCKLWNFFRTFIFTLLFV